MAGLLLTLDGVLYQVLPDGPGAWRLLVLQGKRAGACYAVKAGSCSCPDAQYRERRGCKHYRALQTVGLMLANSPTPALASSSAPG